jgi:hypothetical protein
MARTPVPNSVRLSVLERDGYKCVGCRTANDLALHHRQPVEEGGPNTADNLIVLCHSCHTQTHAERGDKWASILGVGAVGEKSMMLFAEAFAYLAKNPLPIQEQRILDYLFGVLDMNNYLHLKQSDIADELSMDPSHVSRALKHLVEKGFLDAGPKAGRASTYRMSPHLAWRGKAAARKGALVEATKRWGYAK